MEKGFWEDMIPHPKYKLYRAGVDTTFAVYYPNSLPLLDMNCIRMGGSYVAKHMPWYYDINNLPDDEAYYLKNLKPKRGPTHSMMVKQTLVLFLSHAGFPDFQHDIVFHGGRTLLGEDFVDVRKVWHQYKDDKEKYWHNEIPWWNQKLPNGVERMMSLYGLFEEDNIDRTDIEQKIKSKYFDFIILGSVHRVLSRDSGNLYQELVFNTYPAERLILNEN
jgi:hypothetical protein